MITSILLASTIISAPLGVTASATGFDPYSLPVKKYEERVQPKAPEKSTIDNVGDAITSFLSIKPAEKPVARLQAQQPAASVQVAESAPPPKLAIPIAGAATEARARITTAPGEVYRVEIDFDGEPLYKRETGPGYIILNFTSPISFREPAIPEKAKKAIKSVRNVGNGTLRIRVDYDENYHHLLGDRIDTVIVEVKLKPGAKAPTGEAEKKAEEEKKKAEAKKAEELKKAEADKKAAEEKRKAAEEKRVAEEKIAANAKKAEEAKRTEEARKADDAKKAADAKMAVDAKIAADAKKVADAKLAAEAKKAEALKKAEEAAKAAEAKALAKAEEMPKIELPEPAASAPEIIKDAKISFTKSGNTEQVQFDFPQMPGAAVFERFGYVWIVFDVASTAELPKLEGSEVFSAIESVKSEAAAYKLAMKKEAVITTRPSGNSWIVEADSDAENTAKNIRANAVEDNWVITAQNTGKSFKLYDEYTDDPLIVFPLLEPAAGKTEQVNGDFIMGKSAQGVVIRPISDLGSGVTFEGDAIKIKKTASAEVAVSAKAAEDLQPIYPFRKWGQLSGEAYRDAEKAAAAIGKTEHANFLFSQGMYSEANLRLKGFDYATPNFVRAAGNYMMGRYNEAALGFDAVKLEPGYDNNELLMWKIAANEMLSRHNPAGVVAPDTAGFVMPKNIKNYPDKIAAKVILPVAEFFVKAGDNKNAFEALATMPKGMSAEVNNYSTYLQARAFAGEGKKARAREMWEKIAAADTGRESRAKATYEIIVTDLEAGKITPAEAAQKLDRLQIVWKGDKFEYDLLTRLGSLYSGEKQYLKALRVYRAAITKFPGFPENDRIGNDMKALFANALANETDEKKQAFADLTVYYEFKELLPVGDDGDKITMNLVDKLARFDLFEEAAKLLENNLGAVNDPKKRAEFTTRTAILWFMNHQPQKALDTLKASETEEIPSYLREERILIATRSLIEIGDLDAALIAAGALDEGTRNRIRAEIYWKKSDWQKLTDAYKTVEDKTADDVLKLAIANSVLGNKTQLKLMRGQYSEMMAKAGYADEFEYVTNTENINYRDLAGSLQINETSVLINKFRQKIKIEGIKGLDNVASSKTAAKPAPGAAEQPAKPAQ